jgi:hypothetical protein
MKQAEASVTSQKTIFFIVTIVRAPNKAHYSMLWNRHITYGLRPKLARRKIIQKQ